MFRLDLFDKLKVMDQQEEIERLRAENQEVREAHQQTLEELSQVKELLRLALLRIEELEKQREPPEFVKENVKKPAGTEKKPSAWLSLPPQTHWVKSEHLRAGCSLDFSVLLDVCLAMFPQQGFLTAELPTFAFLYMPVPSLFGTMSPTRRSCRATLPPRKKGRIGEDAPTPEIARKLRL